MFCCNEIGSLYRRFPGCSFRADDIFLHAKSASYTYSINVALCLSLSLIDLGRDYDYGFYSLTHFRHYDRRHHHYRWMNYNESQGVVLVAMV